MSRHSWCDVIEGPVPLRYMEIVVINALLYHSTPNRDNQSADGIAAHPVTSHRRRAQTCSMVLRSRSHPFVSSWIFSRWNKAVNRRAFPRRTQSKLANLYRGKHVIYVLLRNYCVAAKETDIALNYFLSSFVVMCQFSVSILGNSCGGAKHFLRLCLPSYLADKLTPFELLPVKIMG